MRAAPSLSAASSFSNQARAARRTHQSSSVTAPSTSTACSASPAAPTPRASTSRASLPYSRAMRSACATLIPDCCTRACNSPDDIAESPPGKRSCAVVALVGFARPRRVSHRSITRSAIRLKAVSLPPAIVTTPPAPMVVSSLREISDGDLPGCDTSGRRPAHMAMTSLFDSATRRLRFALAST